MIVTVTVRQKKLFGATREKYGHLINKSNHVQKLSNIQLVSFP